MKSRFPMFMVVFLLVMSMFLSGCYFQAGVDPNQVGVQMESNAIVKVVGPGIYSGGWFAELKVIDVDTLTFSAEDPAVLTSDNQAVALKVTIQARRKRDSESVTNLMTNWNSLTDDAALKEAVLSTAREGMKNGIRLFTLNSLLDDRNDLATNIKQQLEEDSSKYSVEIVNVTIENVDPSVPYMEALNEKALVRVNTEVELQRQSLINQKASNDLLQAKQSAAVLKEQLNVQKAQTDVDVEIASREGKKTAAAQQVYVDNPQAFELKRLELLRALFQNNTTYFLPSGSDPSMFFNFSGVPVPVVPVPAP